MKDFELFIALRYLRAKRKQAVISIITVISILGVAAGVMALVIALAINNGFRSTLQRNLLGASAHISILEKEPTYGIENWRNVAKQLTKLPGVTGAAPSFYGPIMMIGPRQSTGAILKGVEPATAALQADMLLHLKQGSLDALEQSGAMPGIILGSKLAQNLGVRYRDAIRVISPQGELTPFAPRITPHWFRIVGIFESGFYDLDANWAYTKLHSAQVVFDVEDVVNSIELRVADIYKAPEIAAQANRIIDKRLTAAHWMELNKPILNALKMEQVVTVVTIGLIQLVAALNILIALVMMVMEKNKDIAILISMGAKHQQIRRIFVLQGVIIGVIGTTIGLIAGYSLSWLANRYHWLPLDEQVYALAFVPFEPKAIHAVWIAAVAIGISFIATIYPARNATEIVPVEALRYE